MTTNEQLELGFKNRWPRSRRQQREQRVARAKWWFAKMREAVENAMPWQNQTPPRTEQIWMPGVKREIKV